MMITIHGFPAKTKYQDVKILIKQECNINDFILDNLVSENGTKKVRIGLTDNSEGYRLMKCLDGYRMPGNFVLKAVPVGKAGSTLSQPAPFESQPSYQNQPRNEYSNVPRNDYIRPANDYSDPGPHGHDGPQLHSGPHGTAGPHSSGLHGPRASHIQSTSHGSAHQGGIDPSGRPSPWASGSGNTNQWSSNAPIAAQVPQNTFGFSSSQAVNPSFGHQQQGHPRAGFSQGRASDQSYGFPGKSNIPEVPANSRYRWTKIKKTEPELWNLPEEDEASSDQTSTDSSDDEPTSKEAIDSELAEGTSQSVDPDDPNQQNKDQKPMSNKARKKKENAWRNITHLKAAHRKRLFWWMKRGKTLKEARALCETPVKKCPEYAEAKKFKRDKTRLRKLQSLSPEAQARILKLEQLKGPTAIKSGPLIRLRVVDELGEMSEEKVDQLHDKILELIEAEAEENRPNLSNIQWARYGYMSLTCADQKSVEWLTNALQNLQLWEEAHYTVINISELPKSIIGVAFVPNPNLDEIEIFTMLKSQNPGIDFTDWWITGAKMLPPTGQTVTFNISHNSITALHENNYNVFLGLKKIKIRIKSKTIVPGIGLVGSGPSGSALLASVTHRRPLVKSKQYQGPGGSKSHNYMQARPFGGGKPFKQNGQQWGPPSGNFSQTGPAKQNNQHWGQPARSFGRGGPPVQNHGRGRPNNRQQGGPPGNVAPGGFNPPNQNPQGPPGNSGKRKKKKSKGKKNKPSQAGPQGDLNPNGLWNSWGAKQEPATT